VRPTQQTPTAADAARRARTRMAMIVSGLVDLALAGFFLGWGHSVLGLEHRVAWLIGAALAAFGLATIFVATLVYGRRGQGRARGEGENEPVIRR